MSRRVSPRAGGSGCASHSGASAARFGSLRCARLSTTALGTSSDAGHGVAAAPFSLSSRAANCRASSLKALFSTGVSDRRFRLADRPKRQDVLGFAFPRMFPNRFGVKSRWQSTRAIQAYWTTADRTAGILRQAPRRASLPAGPAPATISAESGCGAGGVAEEFVAAQRGEPRQAVEIAANAKAAIAGKIAGAVVDRQSRQFHRQPAAAIDRPVQGDAAPGVAGGDRLGTRPSGSSPNASAISLQSRPKPAAVRAPIRRVNSSEPSEKRPSAIHLPHEAQRMPPRMRRRLVEPGRR